MTAASTPSDAMEVARRLVTLADANPYSDLRILLRQRTGEHIEGVALELARSFLSGGAFRAGVLAAAASVRANINEWRLHGSIDECGIDLLATAENSIRAIASESPNAIAPSTSPSVDPAKAELVEALEQCAESLAFARDKLGMCGEGDGADRKADADDTIGSLPALIAARAALSKASS